MLRCFTTKFGSSFKSANTLIFRIFRIIRAPPVSYASDSRWPMGRPKQSLKIPSSKKSPQCLRFNYVPDIPDFLDIPDFYYIHDDSDFRIIYELLKGTISPALSVNVTHGYVKLA
jgi:hypothetical protein